MPGTGLFLNRRSRIPMLCLLLAGLLLMTAIRPGRAAVPQQDGNLGQAASDERVPYLHARSVIDYTQRELIEWIPELKKLEFAQTQERLPELLDRVGVRVEEFYREFRSIYALENIYQEREGPGNRWEEYLRLSYHYVISESSTPDELGFVEYRTNLADERLTLKGQNGSYLLTCNKASHVLFFHPWTRAASNFRLVGTEKSGRNATVIAFAQIPEKTKTLGSIIINKRRVATLFQGVIWVVPESGQILRMQTDLLARRTDVGLGQLTTLIDFKDVDFPGLPTKLWLPRDVLVTVQCNGNSFRNRHRFSQYKLFSVEGQDGPKKPVRP
jgi:hypothetical protein